MWWKKDQGGACYLSLPGKWSLMELVYLGRGIVRELM